MVNTNDKLLTDLIKALEDTAVALSRMADAYHAAQMAADTDPRMVPVVEALDAGYPFAVDAFDQASAAGHWVTMVKTAAAR